MVLKTRMTVEQFLALEETKPYLELIDGEVSEKAMPGPPHSAIVSELIAALHSYLKRSKEGRVDTELRHLFRREQRIYLPDISVTLGSRFKRGVPAVVEVVPDFAIEVLSPDDRVGRVMERVDFYLRSGVKLTWIVDPDLETVGGLPSGRRPRGPPRTGRAGRRARPQGLPPRPQRTLRRPARGRRVAAGRPAAGGPAS
jgi:Uma2 family endonuclease